MRWKQRTLFFAHVIRRCSCETLVFVEVSGVPNELHDCVLNSQIINMYIQRSIESGFVKCMMLMCLLSNCVYFSPPCSPLFLLSFSSLALTFVKSVDGRYIFKACNEDLMKSTNKWHKCMNEWVHWVTGPECVICSRPQFTDCHLPGSQGCSSMINAWGGLTPACSRDSWLCFSHYLARHKSLQQGQFCSKFLSIDFKYAIYMSNLISKVWFNCVKLGISYFTSQLILLVLHWL